LRRLAADGKSVRLVVESRFFDAPAWNTAAELPGALWPDDHILLAGHHDTVHGSPGGNDNASGTVAVIETARVLSALMQATGIRPGRAIRFCTWSGEEQKLQGSAAFVRRHYAGDAFTWPLGYWSGDSGQSRSSKGANSPVPGRPEPVEGRTGNPARPPRFALNLDELSTGNVKGVLLNFSHSRGFMQRQLNSLGEGFKCHVLEYLDPYSDHFPFALAAIDSGFLWRWRFAGKHPDSDYHHEPGDTADKINVRELKEYVGFLARLLLRLSHVPPGDWPANPETPASVLARLKAERPFVQRTM
jgi:Zn-dependent M28 family amino/carboxypeptidase